jgi:hypothetical protein
MEAIAALNSKKAQQEQRPNGWKSHFWHKSRFFISRFVPSIVVGSEVVCYFS